MFFSVSFFSKDSSNSESESGCRFCCSCCGLLLLRECRLLDRLLVSVFCSGPLPSLRQFSVFSSSLVWSSVLSGLSLDVCLGLSLVTGAQTRPVRNPPPVISSSRSLFSVTAALTTVWRSCALRVATSRLASAMASALGSADEPYWLGIRLDCDSIRSCCSPICWISRSSS